MKKFLYIAVIGIVIWSCGGGGDDPPAENKPPTTPTTIYPANSDLCIDNAVNFNWNASTDPEGDAITYTVEVSENNSFSPISQTQTTGATSITISLEKGIAFYWRVRAKDSENNSSGNSTVVYFYTEGDGISNHLPFAPVLVAPALNETVKETSTTLSWTASDADTGDTLTFDVYFGTTNPPTTKEEWSNLTANTIDVSTPNPSTYYWKIVVKDDKGGQTIGQIWDFKTD